LDCLTPEQWTLCFYLFLTPPQALFISDKDRDRQQLIKFIASICVFRCLACIRIYVLTAMVTIIALKCSPGKK